MCRRWIIICICSGLAALAGHGTVSPNRTPLPIAKQDVLKQFKATPLAFEANVGQTADAASFVARGQGYALWATAEGPILRLRNRHGSSGAVLRMRVVGGDAKGHPTAETLLPGRANYFLGNDPSLWKTNVPRYLALRYTEVYPGVDLVLHGSHESLEYDFDVAPHTDASQIAVRFEGASDVRIEPTGDLTLTVADGELGFHAPVVYQERDGVKDFVTARYDVDADHVVRFALGEYDRTRPLTIDPVLSYSTYLGGTTGQFGGNGNDMAFALSVDVFGNAYLAGFTNAIDFPLPGAPWDTTCGGCTNSGGDAWVAKIDPQQSGAASLVFATYLGGGGTGSGTGSSTAYGIAADSAGNVYVTGNTSAYNSGPGRAFPITANAFQPNDGGDLAGLDAFLTKLNATGSGLLYSTYIGGNNVDEGSAVKVDDAGHAYVAGWAASTNLPEILNGFKTTNPVVGFDGFVVKFDTTLSGAASLQYGTYVGGHSQDRIGALAIDASGRVYVTGFTQSSGPNAPQPFPVLNGFQTASLGGQDAFMTAIDPSQSGAASLVYSTLISSNGTENGAIQEGGIAVDTFGMVYVTGVTDAPNPPNNFPTTPGAFKTTAEQSDAYIVKIDPSQVGAASLVASTLAGGAFGDGATGIAIDQNNNPVLVGWSTSLTVTCGPPVSGNIDGVVMVFDPSLTSVKASTRIGGAGTDRIYGVAIGPLNQIYVVGYTESSNFPTSSDSALSKAAFDTTSNGQDAFLSVITSLADNNCAAPVAASQSATTAEDTPKPLTLTATDADGNNATPDSLTWKVVSGPTHGNLDVSAGPMTHGAGSNYSALVTYTPAANYSGSDSFTFRVSDGWFTSNIVTVTLTITTVNDPPTPGADSGTTSEDVPVTLDVLANDTDAEGNALNVTQASCSNATATVNPNKTVTVSPALNFNGTVNCTYTVSDGTSTSTGQLTVSVTPVNDSPTANNDAASTQEDTAVTVNVLANDTDLDGDSPAVTQVACSNNAGASVNPNKTITVNPAANFNGTLTCSYTADDGHGGTATGQLLVTVTPVNDNPIAAPDSAATDDNTLIAVAVLANDGDPDGDPVLLDAVGGCQVGEITANPDQTVTYKPKAGFNGTDVCSYTVSDNHGGTASAQLTVGVTKVNEPPTLGPLADQQTEEGTGVSLQVTAGDPDNDALTFSETGLPDGLDIDPATGLISGVPAAGSWGSHQVTVTVGDSDGGSTSATFTWLVTAPSGSNQAPVCVAAQPSVSSIWPVNHSLVPITILGVTDADGGQPAITITRILQDEPTNTAGDGNTWIDGFGIGSSTAQVRAERTGTPKVPGNGRVYEIFFTATDAHGATCSGSVFVGVPHDPAQGPAVDSIIRYDSTVPGGQPISQP